MPKYLIIDTRTGSTLKLTTKRKKFLKLMFEAKEYLELPNYKQRIFKKWCKCKYLREGA